MSVDFCIIGTPKSGTSSLFYWLNAHPQLQGSSPKETFFLLDHTHPLFGRHGASYKTDGPQSYNRFFPSKSETRSLRFESTTHYFYQDTARDYLTSLSPQPLIIMLLREPGARLFSSFRYTRDNLANCDHSLTFDYYIECILEGNTALLDRYYRSASSLYIAKKELDLSRYVMWLNWWRERLDPERLEIILLDDLRSNPQLVMTNLCKRLGVDESFYSDYVFHSRNPTFPIRTQSIHKIALRLSQGLPAGILKKLLKSMYLNWQATSMQPENDFERGLASFRNWIASSNDELGQSYNLNLSHWRSDET
jgi:hypothetical protein